MLFLGKYAHLVLVIFLAIFINFSLCLLYQFKHTYIFDKDVMKFSIKRILWVTRPFHFDTEVKLKHVNKYIDMHVGTLDFELGLISGIIMNRFRYMLRVYRAMSNPSQLQHHIMPSWAAYWRESGGDNDGLTAYERLLKITSCYLAIIQFKNEFFDAVKVFMERQREIAKIIKECKKLKICKNRRSFNQDPTQNLGPEDLEIDYFGHQVPKKTIPKKDKLEELFKLDDNSDKIAYEKLPKVKRPNDKFNKINDWLRYLANGGMKNNMLNQKDDEIEDVDYDILLRTEVTTPSKISKYKTVKPTKPMKTLKQLLPGYLNSGGTKEDNKKPKKSRIPWGEKGSDYAFKKQLRQQYFDKMRGGFDPKREGIDIDLEDMI